MSELEQFFKDNKIIYDYDYRDSNHWWEIFYEDRMVMQIQKTAGIYQFKETIKKLYNNFYESNFDDIDGVDFWFVVENNDCFFEFVDYYKDVLLK